MTTDLKQITDTLPDKLSELIGVAVDDLEKCEKDERYEIQMYCWHSPLRNGKCAVCLAGATVAKSLGLPIDSNSFWGHFSEDVWKKAKALDAVRKGLVEDALNIIGTRRPASIPGFMLVSPYADDPARFKSTLRSLEDRLAAQGL